MLIQGPLLRISGQLSRHFHIFKTLVDAKRLVTLCSGDYYLFQLTKLLIKLLVCCFSSFSVKQNVCFLSSFLKLFSSSNLSVRLNLHL